MLYSPVSSLMRLQFCAFLSGLKVENRAGGEGVCSVMDDTVIWVESGLCGEGNMFTEVQEIGF